MTDEELEQLKVRVERDEPDALYTYARHLEETDPAESDKFYELAAQLGHAKAAERLGNKFLEKNELDRATACFKIGAKAGLIDCSVKLAALNIARDRATAIRELEDLAEAGVDSACIALAEYYKAQGNRKQYAYWSSLVK